jgi:hypothetical protein
VITYSRRSFRLYLANREYVLAVPIYTLGLMLLLSILIVIVVGIATGFPVSKDFEEGFRANSGAILSLPGFLVSVGVLAATRNFAMALAFGSTRRHFWLGTTAGFVVTAAVTAAAAVLMLGLERLITGSSAPCLRCGCSATATSRRRSRSPSSRTAVADRRRPVGTVLRAFGTKATAVLSIGALLTLFAAVAPVVEVSAVAPLLKVGSVGHGHHRCGTAARASAVCRVSPRDRVTE